MLDNPISISDLNIQIKDRLTFSPELQNVWVKGDITSFKVYGYGKQAYLTLSDGNAQINCVMYDNNIQQLKFKPEVGQSVVAFGKVTLFQKKGSLMFQLNYMSTEGAGDLSKEFEALKKKLTADGLFDPETKTPLPIYPKYIALISAPGSAGLIDFITLSQQFAPHLTLTIIPAVVQGPSAAITIMSALDQITDTLEQKPDIVLILRGGGSAEDLSCFNTEELVRHIANYPLPTATAIGHEVDTTLSDLASDHRFPTPSAAAQGIAQAFIEAKQHTQNQIQYIRSLISQEVDSVRDNSTYTLEIIQRLLDSNITKTKDKITHYISRLEAANPLKKLQQGYSITTHEKNGSPIKSINDVNPGDIITITVSDGLIKSQVK